MITNSNSRKMFNTSWIIITLLSVSSVSYANDVLQRLATFRDTPTNKHEQLLIDPETTEQYDPNTGTISFEAIDISIPGNFNIPVELRRVYKPGNGSSSHWHDAEHTASYAGDSLHSFGRRSGNVPLYGPNNGGYGGTWSLDLPYIKGFFIQPINGSSYAAPGGWKDGYVCSQDFTKTSSTGFNGSYTETSPIYTQTYWQGKHLHVPGKVSETFITSTQFDSATQQVTLSNYKISECFTIAGGNEGIRVKGPDGLIYDFGHYLDFVDAEALPQYVNYNKVRRHVVVTKITDKFGNYVNYNWQGHRLTSITSSDNRTITFGYGSNDNITSATANGKTWSYIFNEGDLKVTSPAGRVHDYKTRWYIQTLAYSYEHEPPGGGLQSSNDKGNCEKNSTSRPVVRLHVKLPSGATVHYKLEATYHGKARTRSLNELTGREFFGPNSHLYTVNQFSQPSNLKCSVYYSLTRKSIHGPNMSTIVWDYEYSENEGSYKSGYDYANSSKRAQWSIPSVDKPSTVLNRYDYKTTKIKGPDSVRLLFINRKQDISVEGKIVGINTYEANGTALVKQEGFDYSTRQTIGNHYYFDDFIIALSPINKTTLEERVLLSKTTTKHLLSDGNDIYYVDNQAYDRYGNLTQIKEHNSFSDNVRYYKRSFLNNTQQWQFGLPLKNEQGPSLSNLSETSRIEYHSGSNTGQYSGKNVPYKLYRFGRWQYLYKTYHNDGNPKRVEFNTKMVNASGATQSQNRFVELNEYYRGNTGQVKLPGRYSHTATIAANYGIDYFGNLTYYTDFKGYVTTYGYDDDGFLKSIIKPYPFNGIAITWSTNEVGAWVRTTSECSVSRIDHACMGRSKIRSTSIVYDGLYRPIKTEDTDIHAGNTVYQHFRFDSRNNKTFTSIASYSANDTQGDTTSYDALSRPISISHIDSRTTSFNYKRNATSEVINPSGYSTKTKYLSFGYPSNLPLLISSPESVSTSFAYDNFDNTLSIVQSGLGKTDEPDVIGVETRYYNAYNQLCMVSRADVGNIVYTRNAMGEIVGEKRGAFSNATCTYNAAGSMPKFVLDNHGAIMKQYRWGDGPDITYSLDNIGNALSISQTNGVTTTYTYNSINMPESERLIVQGKVIEVGYVYTPSGALKKITYPNNDRVEYNYNGRGQQISVRRLADSNYGVFTYAQGAKYFANGLLKMFTYGNDVVHSRTLNTRFLPKMFKDMKGSTAVSQFQYSYDKNDNISAITDLRDSRYSLSTIEYDGLDRLTYIDGGSLVGDTELRYDGLGNVTYYKTKNSNLDYVYDRTSNRNLLSRVNGSGSQSKSYPSFTYDEAGNVTNNSHRSFSYNSLGQMETSGDFYYLYDAHNRRVKQSDSSGVTYSLYSNYGKLLYLESSSSGTNHIYFNGQIIARDGSERNENGRQRFKAFGESLDGATENVGYTGHKYDTALSLQYMQARYYDPVIGRFYSNDPVGVVGHMKRGNSPAHGFNRYAYANNNPYKYTDPDGKFAFLVPLVPPAVAALGKALGFVGTAAIAGYAGSEAINAYNESSDAGDFVDDLKDRSEPDANSGKSKIRTITDGTTVDEAFDDFPGETGEASDGSPIKTAEDGTTAHVHSSSKDNGKKTLNIKKPNVKKPIKFREPESGRD